MSVRWPTALCVALALAVPASADDSKAFDKSVVDALRVVHDLGADLYNEGKDFAGAYRVYQGALTTVRPLLNHRPDAQKRIDSGLAAADKETDPAQRAFVLHETIEAVRRTLKAAPVEAKKPDPPAKPRLPLAPPPRAKPKG